MTCLANFEGPEKKLEIVLKNSLSSLQDNTNEKWHRVVDTSRAKIMSSISNGIVDAYLLSESSLFVWDNRVLMITCGDTTLVSAIPEILKLIGDEEFLLFYECRNFNFPDLQPSNFYKDSEKILEWTKGDSYTLGKTNTNHIHIFSGGSASSIDREDDTLQILMDDIDPALMATFAEGNGNSTENIIKNYKFDKFYPDTKLDGYLFSPAGFSVNGIMGDKYYTVHVTPQPNCSYVSFETNYIEENYTNRINEIVSIFRPERFSVILTSNKGKPEERIGQSFLDYSMVYDTNSVLDGGYNVVYRNYRK